MTVTGDRLTAYYRPKAGAPAQSAPTAQNMITGTEDTGGNEIYRVQAEGHVHIFTTTDQVWGDRAIYDIDQSVLVMTGHDLKLTTPNDVITARDDLEYWSQKHMAVARGNAVVVTNDGRRLAADTIVAYTSEGAPQPQPGTPPAATPIAAKPVAAKSGRRTPTISSPHPASCKRSKPTATSRSARRPTPRSATARFTCPTPASPGWRAACASRAARTSSTVPRQRST